jgi:hypothetical protein
MSRPHDPTTGFTTKGKPTVSAAPCPLSGEKHTAEGRVLTPAVTNASVVATLSPHVSMTDDGFTVMVPNDSNHLARAAFRQ